MDSSHHMYIHRNITPRTLVIDPAWEPDTSKNEKWGSNDEQWWADREVRVAAERKANRFPEPDTSTDQPYGIRIVEFKPLNLSDFDHIGKIIERQKQPQPLTTTAKNPRIEMTEDRKRKIWDNLHRQLDDEVEKAMEGGYVVDKKMMTEARRFVDGAGEADSFEIDLMEGRVREIVRELIARRRESQLKK